MSKSINRKDLIEILNKIKPALGNQDYLPILSCFCFEKKNIYAYNDDMCISFPNKDIPFEGAIKGDQLLKLLNSFTSENIKMKIKDNVIHINSRKSNIKLPFLKESSFIWKGISKKSGIKFPIDNDFIEGLKLCLISIGQDVTHPEHMGVQISSDGEEFVMCSTDNCTLSRYFLEDYDGDDFEAIVLPELFCKQIILLFEDMKSPYLFIKKDCVYIYDSSTQIIVLSKLIFQGEGTVFSKVLHKYEKYFGDVFFNIKDSGFVDALDRALIVNGNDINKSTGLIFDNGVVVLNTETEIGHIQDKIKMGKKGVKNRKKIDIKIPTDLTCRASKTLTQVTFKEDIVLFKHKKNFIHIIALVN